MEEQSGRHVEALDSDLFETFDLFEFISLDEPLEEEQTSVKKKNRRSEQKKEARAEDEPVSIWKELRSFVIQLVIMIVIATLFLHYVGQRTVVDGRSMEATLHTGDNLIVDKLTYRFRDPERYEIVVFEYSDTMNFIKRVIGLPGETVRIENSTIYINGEAIDDPYACEPQFASGIAAQEIVLGEDEYFVLGDNRNHSNDSRSEAVGTIGRDAMIGRAIARIWPLSAFGKIGK